MAHSIASTCVGCGACKRVCPVSAIEGLPKELHVIYPSICIDCGACGIVCPVACIADEKGRTYTFLKPRERPKAFVDPVMCSGCQYCMDICPFDCLELRSSPGEGSVGATSYMARVNQCVACRLCVLVCPREAITLAIPVQGAEQSV